MIHYPAAFRRSGRIVGVTVKTTIKFTSDLHGSIQAAVEIVQTAIGRAHVTNPNEQERLERVLAELRASEKATRNASMNVDRNGP